MWNKNEKESHARTRNQKCKEVGTQNDAESVKHAETDSQIWKLNGSENSKWYRESKAHQKGKLREKVESLSRPRVYKLR